MPTKRPPDPQAAQQKRAKRHCSLCKAEGHHCRNCQQTQVPQAPNQAVLPTEPEIPLVQDPLTGHFTKEAGPILSTINWGACTYVIFDVETTGGSRTDDNIIELSAWRQTGLTGSILKKGFLTHR